MYDYSRVLPIGTVVLLQNAEKRLMIVGYQRKKAQDDGKVYDYFPMQQSVLFHAKPIYEELPGWKGEDISECRTFEELPENAQRYVKYIEEKVGVPITIIGVGADRDATIQRPLKA